MEFGFVGNRQNVRACVKRVGAGNTDTLMAPLFTFYKQVLKETFKKFSFYRVTNTLIPYRDKLGSGLPLLLETQAPA